MTVQAGAALLVALGELPGRHRHVFVSYVLHRRSMTMIALELGITRSRVAQLYNEARQRLEYDLEPWREELIAA